jgi:DNA modification methylase
LDTFLGSGSALIGAESLGRRCFGIEIDARYVDALVYRYITYAGKGKVSQEILNKYFPREVAK